MYPEYCSLRTGRLEYPSKFIEVHAKEDPGHSLAIKRTVRKIEEDLDSI